MEHYNLPALHLQIIRVIFLVKEELMLLFSISITLNTSTRQQVDDGDERSGRVVFVRSDLICLLLDYFCYIGRKSRKDVESISIDWLEAT